MEATLDESGRVEIPKELRDRLGLRPGAVLRIEQDADGLSLVPVHVEARLVRDGRALVVTDVTYGGDWDTLIDRARDERTRQTSALSTDEDVF